MSEPSITTTVHNSVVSELSTQVKYETRKNAALLKEKEALVKKNAALLKEKAALLKENAKLIEDKAEVETELDGQIEELSQDKAVAADNEEILKKKLGKALCRSKMLRVQLDWVEDAFKAAGKAFEKTINDDLTTRFVTASDGARQAAYAANLAFDYEANIKLDLEGKHDDEYLSKEDEETYKYK